MRKVLTLLFSFILILSFAQGKFKEVQKVTAEDLKETSSNIQKDAPAEILFRTMHYFVDTSGDVTTKYFERIKIYNKDQASKYLDKEILIYELDRGDRQTLSNFTAVTYNLEGDKVTTTKVDKDSKFRSKEDKNAVVTKFAFPNVKNGSIVEYKYEIFAPQRFLWMMPRFTIDQEIPTQYVDYWLDAPKFLGYNINYKGGLAPSIRKMEESNMYATSYYNYRFGYENVAPFKEEEFVINNDNYKTSIKAELNSTYIDGQFKSYSTTWKDIHKRLYEDEQFGLQLKRMSLVKDLLPEDVKRIPVKKDRANAILKFVQKNYNWNKEEGVFTDKGIRNLLNTKLGNTAEINLLLTMLMRDAGLDANPVVLPTVNRGQLLDYSPTITQLNYIFTAVEDGGIFYYYDATEKNSDVYELPLRALNGTGILMTEKDAKIVDVFYPLVSKTFLTVDAKLNSDGTFSGTFKDRDTNLFANFVNDQYLENKENFQKTYKDKYTFPYTDIKSGLQDNGDFETSFNFNSDTFVDAVGKKLVFNPLLFLHSQNHSYTQTDERKAPLEFFSANEKTKSVTITIPEGYTFENIPKSKKFRTDDSSIEYLYSIKQEGNKLTVETTTKIGESSFPKEYYPAFKQIYDNITKLEGQVVTAVKK